MYGAPLPFQALGIVIPWRWCTSEQFDHAASTTERGTSRVEQSPQKTKAEALSGQVSVILSVTISLLLTVLQPPQFKLDPRLARLLGIHTQTRSAIIQALWQYIKTNKLQDSHDKEYINCDKYFQQVIPF